MAADAANRCGGSSRSGAATEKIAGLTFAEIRRDRDGSRACRSRSAGVDARFCRRSTSAFRIPIAKRGLPSSCRRCLRMRRSAKSAFARLRDVENRRREPWVLESLAYLNHPCAPTTAIRFLRPQPRAPARNPATGDIFFPTRWAEAALSGHRSPEAAAIVRDFPATRASVSAAIALDRSQRGRRAVPDVPRAGAWPRRSLYS